MNWQIAGWLRVEFLTDVTEATWEGEMIMVAAVLLVVSIVGLIAALVIGTPVPGNPRHGTFAVEGINGSYIAWACVALCAVGLVLLFLDSRRKTSEPAQLGELAADTPDDLFGKHDVERELVREERVVNPDMLGSNVPAEEANKNL